MSGTGTHSNPVDRARRLARRRVRRLARRMLPPDTRGRVAHEPNPPSPQLLAGFRFFAVLGTWMEEDVVEATVRNAFAQGVEEVFLIDNASTDATVARAVDAGATLAETYDTAVYDERIRILLMNGVVARQSFASGADHVWWLWLDADEFPEGPGGMTIADYLATLDRRFRVVGSTYYNHFPDGAPQYLSGFHPLDFQPLCERYLPLRQRFCDQPHWKHPLQRFDRSGPFLMAIDGFHTGSLRTRDPVIEPNGGIVTHHVQYRDEAATKARMDLLCGGPARNDFNDGLGHRTIQRRYDSLEAVYARHWSAVNNQRGEEPMLGVHPEPWPNPESARRWYGPDDLAAAKAAWAGTETP